MRQNQTMGARLRSAQPTLYARAFRTLAIYRLTSIYLVVGVVITCLLTRV